MTDLRLSSGLRLILDRAVSEAKRHGHGAVSPLHLVLAVERGNASYFTEEQRRTTEHSLQAISPSYESPVPSPDTNDILAKASNANSDPTLALVDLLKEFISRIPEPQHAAEDDGSSERQHGEPANDADPAEPTGEKQGLPNQLKRVLTEAPSEPLSVPRVGTVHRILSMLGARQPQPVLLVGAEGSGRTAIAQAIASTVQAPDYSGPLAGSPVWITQASRIGDQPQQLVGLSEVPRDHIVFIDDLELLYPLGRLSGGMGMPGFRPLLGDQGPRIVLSITEPDVDAMRSADPELMDELEIVHLPGMSEDEIALVAAEAAAELAAFHEVDYPHHVIAAAAAPPRASDSHCHPALAVRRLDRAGSAARMRQDRTASASDLGTEVASQQYVTFDPERARAALSASVFGQDEAIVEVTERLAVTRASLDLRPERPDGVFLFAGPTGTGKTELARAMALEIFGSEQALIRLDMSEFSEPHTVSKLIGSPPGYVGSTEPSGWLSTRIRRRPQSLLLLDEFEKAHPIVWNTFLQVFDTGTLTDSQGNSAQFSDTVVVLTSNVGARHFADKKDIGFLPSLQDSAATENAVREEVKRVMAPELLNRLDGVLVFHPLTGETVRSIARKNINAALSRLSDRGVVVDVTDSLEDAVCERGFSREYGARPLLRVVESLVVRPIAGAESGEYVIDFVNGKPEVQKAPAQTSTIKERNQT